MQGASTISVDTGNIRLYSCGITKLFVCSAQVTLTGVNTNAIRFVFQNIPNYANVGQSAHFIHFGPDATNSHNYSILVSQTSIGIVKNATWNDVSGTAFTNNTRTRLVCYLLFV